MHFTAEAAKAQWAAKKFNIAVLCVFASLRLTYSCFHQSANVESVGGLNDLWLNKQMHFTAEAAKKFNIAVLCVFASLRLTYSCFHQSANIESVGGLNDLWLNKQMHFTAEAAKAQWPLRNPTLRPFTLPAGRLPVGRDND